MREEINPKTMRHGAQVDVNVDIRQRRKLILEGIARGELAFAENRVLSHEQAERYFLEKFKK